MESTTVIVILAEVAAAAIGFGTAWAMRSREVDKARHAAEQMRELWARLEQSPAAGSALRNRRTESTLSPHLRPVALRQQLRA